jgi:hypothetical protein
MSDTIQSAEEIVDDIREEKYGCGYFISTEKARKLIESRDSAIRADEARKQAERYAYRDGVGAYFCAAMPCSPSDCGKTPCKYLSQAISNRTNKSLADPEATK